MSTFLLEFPPTIAWEFDGTFNWSETHSHPTTKRKVEGAGVIADYISKKPFESTVRGKVTASLIDPNTGQVNQARTGRMQSARDGLVALIAKHKILQLSAKVFSGPIVVDKATIEISAEGGDALDISISVREVEFTRPATATVAASRLKKKLKKRSGGSKGSSGQSFAPRKGSPAEVAKTKEIIASQWAGNPWVK